MLIADLRRRCFPLHFSFFFVGAYYRAGSTWQMAVEGGKINLCTYFSYIIRDRIRYINSGCVPEKKGIREIRLGAKYVVFSKLALYGVVHKL